MSDWFGFLPQMVVSAQGPSAIPHTSINVSIALEVYLLIANSYLKEVMLCNCIKLLLHLSYRFMLSQKHAHYQYTVIINK